MTDPEEPVPNYTFGGYSLPGLDSALSTERGAFYADPIWAHGKLSTAVMTHDTDTANIMLHTIRSVDPALPGVFQLLTAGFAMGPIPQGQGDRILLVHGGPLDARGRSGCHLTHVWKVP